MKKHAAALKLRELREDSQLYQRQLAEFLGCTQQTYSRYETGELNPSLTMLERLSEFYDTSVDYLIGFTNERRPHKRSIR